jgi:hypothetical protein
VATADPAIVDVLLRRRPDDCRRNASMSGVIDEIAPHGVAQSLNAAYLRQYFTMITRVTERLVRQWEAAAVSGDRIDVLDG